MRLWTVHPRHLDRQGLTGCWRETLLAQAVLAGRTRGYRSHPQLQRFREQGDPLRSVGAYLDALAREASERGYRFDVARNDHRPPEPDPAPVPRIPVTTGQVELEWRHLLEKLSTRSPERWQQESMLDAPDVHPLFSPVPGRVEPWERASG